MKADRQSSLGQPCYFTPSILTRFLSVSTVAARLHRVCGGLLTRANIRAFGGHISEEHYTANQKCQAGDYGELWPGVFHAPLLMNAWHIPGTGRSQL